MQSLKMIWHANIVITNYMKMPFIGLKSLPITEIPWGCLILDTATCAAMGYRKILWLPYIGLKSPQQQVDTTRKKN